MHPFSGCVRTDSLKLTGFLAPRHFNPTFTFKMEAVCSSETWSKNHKDNHHFSSAAFVLSLAAVSTEQHHTSALR